MHVKLTCRGRKARTPWPKSRPTLFGGTEAALDRWRALFQRVNNNMIKSDFGLFSADETRELDDTFYSESVPIRRRYILYGSFLAVAFAAGLLAWGASAAILAAAFIAYILLSAVEKLSYITAQNLARGVTQKLIRRIEQLEGVPATPDNARPHRTNASAV